MEISNSGNFDPIAQHYKGVQEYPWLQYVGEYLLFLRLGDLSGKSILDLGCGDGYFSRKFKQRGAARVVGVDISEKMIALATEEETKEPLGIEYIVADIAELGEIGSFDLSVAYCLLCLSQTKENLLKTSQTIFTNLKPLGRFYCYDDNLEQAPDSYPLCKNYGYTKSISERLQEGTPITQTIVLDGQEVVAVVNCLTRANYEWAFQTAGFREIHWHKSKVSPEGVQKFGEDYWQDFLNYQMDICFECVK